MGLVVSTVNLWPLDALCLGCLCLFGVDCVDVVVLGLCLRGGCLRDWLVMAALRLWVVKGLFSAW